MDRFDIFRRPPQVDEYLRCFYDFNNALSSTVGSARSHEHNCGRYHAHVRPRMEDKHKRHARDLKKMPLV